MKQARNSWRSLLWESEIFNNLHPAISDRVNSIFFHKGCQAENGKFLRLSDDYLARHNIPLSSSRLSEHPASEEVRSRPVSKDVINR